MKHSELDQTIVNQSELEWTSTERFCSYKFKKKYFILSKSRNISASTMGRSCSSLSLCLLQFLSFFSFVVSMADDPLRLFVDCSEYGSPDANVSLFVFNSINPSLIRVNIHCRLIPSLNHVSLNTKNTSRLSLATENVSMVPGTGKIIQLCRVLWWMSTLMELIIHIYFFKYKINILSPIALWLWMLLGMDLQKLNNSSVFVICYYEIKLFCLCDPYKSTLHTNIHIM